MKKIDNKVGLDEKANNSIKNKVTTLALWISMLFPNANFANEKTTQDLVNNFWTEISYNPNLKLKTENTINFQSNPIPPKLKAFYKKLWSIKKKEDLKNLTFTQREMWFLETGQFMDPERITKSLWAKASKQLIHVFSLLTKEDLKRFFIDYKNKNPNVKISKKEFNVLSQPIDWKAFSIRANVDGREYRINKNFDEKWYLVNSPAGSLFMCKYLSSDINGKKYESRFIYNENWKNSSNKTPILISSTIEWKAFVQDINWQQLTWRCAIWTDGNLYWIDQDGNAIWKDWKKYPITEISFDKSKFVFVRNYSLGEIKKDNIDWGVYRTFNVSWTPRDMLADRYNSKKNILLMRFRNKDLVNLWYEMIPHTDNKTLFLRKNDVKSKHSNDILTLDYEAFDKWIEDAKKEIDDKFDQIEIYSMEYKKKEEAFEKFVKEYCVVDTTKNFDSELIYPFSGRKSVLSELSTYNSNYGIKKWQSLEDNQSAYIIIVDLQDWTELNNENNRILHITEKNGNLKERSGFYSSILMTIKNHENKKSFISFLKLILDQENISEEHYPGYINKWVTYRWYYVQMRNSYDTSWEYSILVSKEKKTWTNINEKNIKVSKDMTGEEIKSMIDEFINSK